MSSRFYRSIETWWSLWLDQISASRCTIPHVVVQQVYGIYYFPDSLEVAEMKALKLEITKKVNNNRPIWFLCNSYKYFEKIMKKNQMIFCEKYNLIFKNHFGFRKGRSTEETIASIINKSYQNVDPSRASLCVFVDWPRSLIQSWHRLDIYFGKYRYQMLIFSIFLKLLVGQGRIRK